MKAFSSYFRLLKPFAIFASLLLVYFLLRFFLIDQSSPSRVARNISETISAREQLLADAAVSLSTEIQDFEIKNLDIAEALFSRTDLLRADYFVAVIQNSELIFWNSSAAFPIDIVSDSLADGLVTDRNTGNYFIQQSMKHGELQLKIFDLVYENHSFKNQSIHHGFSKVYGNFARLFSLIPSDSTSDACVKNSAGVPLFNIQQSTDSSALIPPKAIVFLFCYLLLLLAWFYYSAFLLLSKTMPNAYSRYKYLIFGLLVFCVQLVLRGVGHQVFFVASELFHPAIFSFGNLFPSLGFLLIHVEAFLAIALVASYSLFQQRKQIRFPLKLHVFFYLFMVMGLLWLESFFVESIFYQTAVPLSFSKFFVQNVFSYAVFGAVILLSLAVIMLVYGYFERIKQLKIKLLHLILFIIFGFILLLIFMRLMQHESLVTLLFVGFSLLLLLIHIHIKSSISTQGVLIQIGLFFLFGSLLTTAMVRVNNLKSLQSQQLTAQQLSIDSDPLFEFMWKDALTKIKEDSSLQRLIELDDTIKNGSDERIAQYFNTNFLTEFSTKYDIEVTVCSDQSQLLIQPLNVNVNCADYFGSIILEKGSPTSTDQLYLIDDDIQGIYYIATIPLAEQNQKSNLIKRTVFVEFYYKYLPEGLGYPELLIDESKGFSKDFSNYSFATYKDSTLIYKFGNYLYPTIYSQLRAGENQVFIESGYKHVIQSADHNKIIVVSLPLKSWATMLAPFSFFFLLLTLPSLAFSALISHKKNWFKPRLTFKAKLQLLIISSLLFSFIVIGIGTIYYITDVYNKKNDSFLFEKTQSILIELEHKLKNENLTRPDLRDYLHQLLLKFSLVFFSDINIYGLDGQLIASSRYDIFDQHLLSPQMNPKAFDAMHFDEKLFFLHEEQIGNTHYLSSYIPFKNEKGNVFAYINLPYFAKESEIRNEISALVLTYLNLFLVISAVAIAMVLLLSRKLLQPLQMIQEKMRLVRIDRVNEKIIWKSKDELGQFVAQYNTLITELAESAERLARSERESAWREMAKQVAHEIKNPLTPMRLSVQYLLRAWDNNDPDIANKIKLTSQTLIHQIDTLSSIATAFSDFARMPINKPQKFNMAQWLRQLIVLFDNHANIRFATQFEGEEQSWVTADQDNMNRIFTNLIKNSTQAIGDKPGGVIILKMKPENQKLFIELSDNGKGMNAEEAKRVFTPNFTTKSSGMGIGLAMVNNLVNQAGGTISFTTEQGKGTVFYLQLPLHPSWHKTQ